MDKVDVQAWLKGEVERIVKLYEAGQRGEAFDAFAAVVGKSRFWILDQGEKEAAFLKPLEGYAATWEEKEGLVIAGRIRAWMEDHIRAIAKLDLAIALDAGYALAYNFRGAANSNLGDKHKAILDYDKAIALDNGFADAYSNRGIAYAQLGETQKAMLDYSMAIALDPEDTITYYNRGLTYFLSGNKEKALLDYEKAISLEPDFADPYITRGAAYFEMGANQKAILDFDKAIALDPGKALAFSNRGNVYSALGEWRKALLDHDKAIELIPEFAGAYSNRGSAYYQLGDKQKALLDYRKAISLDPIHALAFYNRSFVLEDDANFKEAIQDLEKFLELSTEPFWIERVKARLVDLHAKLQNKAVGEITGLVDKIREALRFDGAQISHFTPLTGARFMMLEKSPFRLSEASFMNDPSEGKALFDLHELPASFNVNAGSKDGEYIKKPFFGCFVKAEMKDDLAMWRLYGHDAAGASITFNRSRLLSALMQNPKLKNLDSEASAGRPIFEFFLIAYFDEKGKVVLPGKSVALKKTLQGHLDDLKKALLAVDADEKSKPFLHLIREKVASIMYLFKSAQYQYEKEVRLLVSDEGFDVVINAKDYTPPRAYLEIAPIHQAVECITLGPKVPRSEEWVSAFYYFFDKEKVDVKLHLSRQPYK